MERDGQPVHVDTRKAVALAAYLAVTGTAHSREALAALLWPEYEPERAHANLRRTLWALNKAVGPEWLDLDGDTIALRLGDGLWIDVAAFRAHLAEALAHGHGAEEVCEVCVPALEAAVQLCRGELLAGFSLPDSPAFEEWLFFEAESVRQGLASALERLADHMGAAGRHTEAIAHARRRLALDPLQEAAHRRLMVLYAKSGQRAAALRQFEECARVLKEEVRAKPEEATVRLYEKIQASQTGSIYGIAASQGEKESDTGTRRGCGTLPAAATRLPVPSSPLVGREEELREIVGMLEGEDCRLVTLVGPGGIGKTRLALEAAGRAASASRGEPLFPHGTFWVPLAAVERRSLMPAAIADACGFSFYQREGEDPERQLLNYLSGKGMLLVLDNLEHLVDGGSLVAAMLAEGPGIKVLATSRQRLDLSGEWVYEVQGLGIPQAGEVPNLEHHSGPRLFVQRARMADRAYAPSTEDLGQVARICRLVGGLPLGIELAAALVRLLPVGEIADEIERSLDILDSSMRDLPPRHRSLRAVCQHSWQLLDGAERQAVRRLSVFRSGFGRAMAQEVTGTSLAMLSVLVDKSLLRHRSDGRFEMHGVLRHYTAEQLAADPAEMRQTEARHGRAVAAFLQRLEPALQGPRQCEALDEIAAELGNVRQAWQWAVAHCDIAALRQSANSLFQFYLVRSRFEEGEAAFAQAAAALESPLGRAACSEEGQERERLLALGMLLIYQGRLGFFVYGHDRVETLIARGVELLRPLGAGPELAQAYLAALWHGIGEEPVEFERLLNESQAIFEEAGDRRGVARCVAARAFAFGLSREETVRLLRESLAISAELGDLWDVAYTLFSLGEAAHTAGAFEEARHYFEQCLESRMRLGDRQGTGMLLDYLGYMAREQGEYDEARRLHRESLALSEEIGDKQGVAGSLDNLGLLARDEGNLDEARRLLGQGLAIRRAASRRWETAVSLLGLGTVGMAAGELEEARQRFDEALALSRTIVWDQGIALALAGLAWASTKLGEPERARKEMVSGLMIAGLMHNAVQVQEVLVVAAQVLDAAGQGERAAQVLAFVLTQPATHATRLRAQGLLARMVAEPGAATLAAARAWAAGKDPSRVAELAQEWLSS